MSEVKVNKINTRTNTALTIQQNSNTAMTIDTSRNVLVGKTSIGIATVGGELRADGQITGTKDGGASLALNRKTSDGDIAVFQKDGTTQGSIGSSGGNYLTIGNNVNTRLRFTASDIRPCDSSGADRDNAIDLGDGVIGARFKDLYLAGNIYLGGTGSANALDDYEEGTFTASYGSATDTGYYTKIGREVVIHLILDSAGQSFNTITGLPFTVQNNSCVTFARILGISGRDRSNLGAGVSGTDINIYNEDATTTTITTTSTTRLDILCTYRTA